MIDFDKKIGQFVKLGFEGTQVSDSLVELIKTYKVGNFILFERNIGNIQDVILLNQFIYNTCIQESGISPIIALDQEGGMVSRLCKTEESTIYFPSAKVMSVASDKDTLYVYEKMALVIKNLGFTVNLAPVVDINSNPMNPVIGSRSFGNSVNIVNKKARLFLEAHKKHGLISVGKHFPGHGDTFLDSHMALPTIKKELESLKNDEIIPFQTLINLEVEGIMLAHIIFESIDTLPATLSKKTINILTQDMHFDGLIFSDCMRMKSIEDNYTNVCVKAIVAGIDICGISKGIQEQFLAIKNITEWGLENYNEVENRFNKIIAWKKKYNNFSTNITQVKSILEDRNLYDKINDIYQQSFVVQDAPTCKKLNINNTYLVDFYPYSVNDAESQGIKHISFYNEIQKKFPIRGRAIKADDEISLDLITAMQEDAILIITYRSFQNQYQNSFIHQLKQKYKKVIVVYTVDEQENIKNEDAYFLLHEYSKGSINAFIERILNI